MTALFGTIAALAAAVGGVEANAEGDPCGPDADKTACFVAHQQEYLAAFGLPTAESRLAATEEIRRVMIFGRMRNPVVAIEFRRAAAREPTVAIYGPAPEGGSEAVEPAYSAAVPLAEWERIGAASRHFERTLAPLPPGPPGDAIFICSDAWLNIVETTDPSADSLRERLRRRAEDTCEQGLANAFAEELADTAARLLPACLSLVESEDFAPSRLSACAKLRGDRMAAALAYNVLEALRRPRSEDATAYLFSDRATLDWTGERHVGARDIGRMWHQRTATERATFFPQRLRGENSSRVQVEGRFERWTSREGGDSALWVAPVVLVMELDPNAHRFRIRQASVGDYEPARHYCQPGYLEPRCQ